MTTLSSARRSLSATRWAAAITPRDIMLHSEVPGQLDNALTRVRHRPRTHLQGDVYVHPSDSPYRTNPGLHCRTTAGNSTACCHTRSPRSGRGWVQRHATADRRVDPHGRGYR